MYAKTHGYIIKNLSTYIRFVGVTTVRFFFLSLELREGLHITKTFLNLAGLIRASGLCYYQEKKHKPANAKISVQLNTYSFN
jgi:hypothetical protein